MDYESPTIETLGGPEDVQMATIFAVFYAIAAVVAVEAVAVTHLAAVNAATALTIAAAVAVRTWVVIE